MLFYVFVHSFKGGGLDPVFNYTGLNVGAATLCIRVMSFERESHAQRGWGGAHFSFWSNQMTHVFCIVYVGAACNHSEKLALAWAVLEGESNILLTKNLRMCGPCHESTRAICKLESLTVRHRDASRFHFMSPDGSCSCDGFW